MALGFTQSPECQKLFLGTRARPASKADNLAAICEPIVWKIWDPQHLTSLISLARITQLMI
jgi:hypothetical protein